MWYARIAVQNRVLKGALLDSMDSVEPDETNPVLSYTLDTRREHTRLSKPKVERITCLDPNMDHGLVIIRHHLTSAHMEAYVDALTDAETHEERSYWMTFETTFGCFSILWRPGNPEAKVQMALMYISKVMDPLHEGLKMDWYKIFNEHGEEIEPGDILPEYEMVSPL